MRTTAPPSSAPFPGGLPRWDWMMAASLVVMLPVVIVFFLGQRYFVEGITMSGIKR